MLLLGNAAAGERCCLMERLPVGSGHKVHEVYVTASCHIHLMTRWPHHDKACTHGNANAAVVDVSVVTPHLKATGRRCVNFQPGAFSAPQFEIQKQTRND